MAIAWSSFDGRVESADRSGYEYNGICSRTSRGTLIRLSPKCSRSVSLVSIRC